MYQLKHKKPKKLSILTRFPIKAKHRGSTSGGFTLLEVLIALTILAVSSLAIIRQTVQSNSQLQQLQVKTYATIVADNQMTAHRIAQPWPDVGRSSLFTTFAQRQWTITTEVTGTSDGLMRKITVSVNLKNDSSVAPAVSSIDFYRGRY